MFLKEIIAPQNVKNSNPAGPTAGVAFNDCNPPKPPRRPGNPGVFCNPDEIDT